MQFLLSFDLRQNLYLRILLLIFVVFSLFFLALNLELEAHRLGLFPHQVLISLLGDPEAFLPPKNFSSLLTDIHVNLFIYPLIVLANVSILVHAPLSPRAKIFWILCPSMGILAETLGIFATLYVAPWLVWFKVIGFWTFEISMLIMVGRIFIYLLGQPQKSPKAGFRPHA